MIKNYFLVAFRNLRKNKVFSFINIAGLAVAMAACLLIIQYVVFELSYDNFLPNKGQVYRLIQDRYNDGKLSTQWAAGAFAAGTAFKEAFPEIENVVKIVPTPLVQLSSGEKKVIVTHAYFASKSFFEILGYPVLQGDLKSALANPYNIVISRSTAQKLFGKVNPIGHTIVLNKISHSKLRV